MQNLFFILRDEDYMMTFLNQNILQRSCVIFLENILKNTILLIEIKTLIKWEQLLWFLTILKALVLNENHMFSDNEMAVLTNHEIGVHMVTTMNGLLHPLKIFSHGFPNNEETQEGLAVFSEYMSGNLTVKRLKELAYRVIAVDSLAKGYSFSRTFRLLHNDYDLEREEAFYITMRAHRGGGFTKDYLYLTGLKKVYDYYHQKKT